MDGSALMSIGEVLARLREDFPDVTISKLRFLEAEGLVEPVRTAAGYRKYAAADVERLSFVLAAQRDRFLPLRVIRDHLAALDRGEPAVPLDYGFDGDAYPVRATPDGEDDPATGGPLRRDEMLARTGLSDVELTELEDAGLVCRVLPGGTTRTRSSSPRWPLGWVSTGSAYAISGRTAPPPIGKSVCSPRSSRHWRSRSRHRRGHKPPRRSGS